MTNKSSNKKKIIIASGGTGGHFYPGYAIGKELISKGYEVLFVIKKSKSAEDKLEKEGLNYTDISLVGLPREFDLRRYIKFIIKLVQSIKMVEVTLVAMNPNVYLSDEVIAANNAVDRMVEIQKLITGSYWRQTRVISKNLRR